MYIGENIANDFLAMSAGELETFGGVEGVVEGRFVGLGNGNHVEAGSTVKSQYLIIYKTQWKLKVNERVPMFPTHQNWLVTHPSHINQILNIQFLPHIPQHPGFRLLPLLILALQGIERDRLIGSKGVDIGTRIHESRMMNRGAVVDDLVQCFFFIGLAGVEDGDEIVGAS